MKLRNTCRSPGKLAVSCVAAGAILGGTVFAQETETLAGGLRFTLGLTGALRADDNPDLSFDNANPTVFQDTRLSFGLINETALDTLRINFNGGLQLRQEDDDGFSSDFEDPRASLSYVRQGVNSRFAVNGTFRQTRLEFFDVLAPPDLDGTPDPDDPPDPDVPPEPVDPLDPTDLVQSTGTRLVYSVGSTLELGLNDPLGVLLEARRQKRDYSDVTDPDLFDTTTDTLNATLRFDLSPVITSRLRLSNRQYVASDTLDTERETQEYALGATLDVTQTMVLDVSLGQTRILTDETIGGERQSREQNGVNASASLVQDMTNGSVALRFSRSFGVNDERDSIEVSRSLDLPRGSLDAAIGATRGNEGKTQVTLRLAYQQDLARGSISASVQRNVTTNVLNEDVLTTRASLGYRTDLTAVSALSLALDYTQVTDAGAGSSTDRERATLRASYSHDLTKDVVLTAGYQHRFRSEDDDKANSNSISLSISRRFNLRP